jgi:hypothetical protein
MQLGYHRSTVLALLGLGYVGFHLAPSVARAGCTADADADGAGDHTDGGVGVPGLVCDPFPFNPNAGPIQHECGLNETFTGSIDAACGHHPANPQRCRVDPSIGRAWMSRARTYLV